MNSPYSMPEMHSHFHYELFYLLEGSRNVFIENKLYVLQKNSVIIYPPFVMHRVSGGPFVRFVIDVYETFFEKDEYFLLKKLAKDCILLLDERTAKHVTEQLEFLHSAQNSSTPEDKALFRISVKALIAQLYQIKHSERMASAIRDFEKPLPLIVSDIILYIDNNLSHAITMKDLMDAFHFSRGYLTNLFKKHLGLSISNFILKQRLNKAKLLLTSTKKSMEEISAECGFDSANYFSLIFKRHVSLSPTRYRRYEQGCVPPAHTHPAL
jgi:AraC-like DNA-binding protein